MKIDIDWDRGKRKINSNKKIEEKKPNKAKNTKQISSKSITSKTIEKIGVEFIDSIKYTHIPGKISIEIGYSLDNRDEDQKSVHVKAINREQIKGLKRILNIFED